MANGVRIDQLGDAIASAVREYTEDVSAAIARKTDEVAQTMLVEIAQAAPFRNGNYARALIISSKDEYGKTRRIIWNKKYYNLVHLLEFGHALRGGGRAGPSRISSLRICGINRNYRITFEGSSNEVEMCKYVLEEMVQKEKASRKLNVRR